MYVVSSEYRLSVDSAVHRRYGLGYPVTYVFELLEDVDGVKVQYRFTLHEKYRELGERVSGELFNGINAVRFSYNDHRVFVSIAFAEHSDEIYLRFIGKDGRPAYSRYLGVSPYYDNRKAAVVITADDWDGDPRRNEGFLNLARACQERLLWCTVGIVTRGMGGEHPPDWSAIQGVLDRGFIEAASHSATHPHVPYGDYDAEVLRSRDDIVSCLSLPHPYRMGAMQYVWAWIEPYGEVDDTVRLKLGQAGYLVDRGVETGVTVAATWDDTHGLFRRIGYTIEMGSTPWKGSTTDLDTLNSLFDKAYRSGGIYHLMMHPALVDWTPGSYAYKHLDYIAGRSDVWYVGFGALYMYRFIYERDVVRITPIYI